MAAKTTSYIDARGVKRTGYIIDGRTYEDADATTPVGRGSIVEAGGRRYVKGVGENGASMLYSDYLSSQNMKATDYVDSQGLLKTGYIKDGKTYADILATVPVEKGSTVSAGAQLWVKGVGENGESLPYSDYLKSIEAKELSSDGGPFISELEQMARDEYERAKELSGEAYSLGLLSSGQETDRRKAETEKEYEQLGAQLYRDYMLRKKELPQLLAAQGITGGLTESSLLGLEAGYSGELAEQERGRLSRLGDIEAEAAETARKLLQQKAEAEAKAEDKYAERRLDILQRRAAEAKETKGEAEAAETLLLSRAAEKAETLAKYGDFSGYRALGFSEEEIAAMEKAYYEEQFSARLKIAQQKARYGDTGELLELLGLGK